MNENELENRVKQLEETVAFLVGLENQKAITPLLISEQIQQINDEDLISYPQDLNWPAAVEASLICNRQSEDEKFDRAEGILDMVVTKSIKNTKFLDFGCGQGHVAEKALAQNCKLTVGYDIESQNWDKRKIDEKLLLTTDWNEVKKNGPYEVVLVYDVLDHIVTPTYEIIDCHNPPNNIIEAFKAIKSVTAPAGTIYVRCHPWTSRHGSHLYQKINKAFLQLIFTDEELIKIGATETKLAIQKIIHPLDTYSKIFSLAGFRNIRENARLTEPIEPFFERNLLIAKRIKQNWRTSPNNELRAGTKFPIFQMEIQFLDYILQT